MKIAIIDNYDSFVYNLVRYVQETEGVTEVRVMRNDAIDEELLNTSAGILLSPGPGIPSEAGELLRVIDRYSTEKSVFGVCLGHQAIGEYFKGKLEKAPIIYHGKTSIVNIVSDSKLFKGLSEHEAVGRYHSWQISQNMPSCLKVTATDDSGNVMAFEHRELPIMGVQFHPESILTPNGRIIIKNWIKTCTH
jgi:anthranilate synthase component 2